MVVRVALLCGLLLGLGAVAARDRADVSSWDVSSLDALVDTSEDLGETEEQDPPTTAEAAGPVAAINQPVATAAAAAGSGNSSGVPTEPIVLPPPIFGGTEGDFLFKVTAHLGPTGVAGGSGQRELGETATAKAVATVEQSPVDKAYRSLFDLKPLFMGIQADIHRRRALVGGVCVMSLRDIVHEGICKEGHTSTSGACSMYSVPPMTVAMQALFKNAKTNFCKFNATDCDATLCYTYGGPVAADTGLQQSSYHTMQNIPIWVRVHKSVTNGTAVPTDTVITQSISFKITLEKAVFCEKMDPQQTPDGHVKVMNCHTSRRCQMLSLEHGECQLASSDTEPAPSVPCPTDLEFVKAVQAKEGELTSTMCSTL